MECIHSARTFQRTLYNMCAKDDQPMTDAIFKLQKKEEKVQTVGSAAAQEILEHISSDTNKATRARKIA